MGIFITFEGIEGCGKTTQMNLARKFLSSKGYSLLVTREPGGTKIGDQIRKILLNSQGPRLSLYAELFLYLATRAQHVEEIIKPALKEKEIVLCDRFSDASLAYQGFGQGLDLKLIHDLNLIVTSGLRPDLTILIDCPVEIGLKRAKERIDSKKVRMKEDRFEKKGLEFHQKVREAYLQLAREEPERIQVIEGNKDKESIHQRICVLIMERLKRYLK